MTHCKVSGCRFASYHTTRYHKCGKCHQKGHGLVECKSTVLQDGLKPHMKTDLPKELHCRLEFCQDPESHLDSSHQCFICNQPHDELICHRRREFFFVKCPFCRVNNIINKAQPKMLGMTEKCSICEEKVIDTFFPKCGHSTTCSSCVEELNGIMDAAHHPHTPGTLGELAPPIMAMSIAPPEVHTASAAPVVSGSGSAIIDNSTGTPDLIKSQALDNMGETDGKIFTVVPAGMGCEFYVRRDGKDNPIQSFPMSADSWGQYGPMCDDRPALNNFISGYKQV